jgi:SNF2 family DNA or RNA helicase
MVMTLDQQETEEKLSVREYQRIGTGFLRAIRRGFLTDDPGLGKTFQAAEAAELPCMIVAPKYLGGQWADFLSTQYPDTVVAHADGTRTQRDAVLSKKADWYVVNLEMLHSYDMPSGIRTFINDESHHLRNRTATQSRAAYALENLDKTSRIYHLSATPMWKSVADIWMQAHILYPTVFSSYHEFVKLYCVTANGPYGVKILGIRPKMKKPLKELLNPIMLGRTYKDVGRYLPTTVDTIIKLDLPEQYRTIYKKMVSDYQLTWDDEEGRQKLIFQATTVLHALRQITMYAGKIEAIEGILEDNNDKPAVIGFWYKDHARMMYQKLGKSRAVLITGDIESTERHRIALWAQRNGKHIVASQMSLSEGINLHQYRLFIFGEENYVPGSNHQFLSRVVRDRQDGGLDESPVRVFYVQARKTIDESVHRVTKTRSNTISTVQQLLEQTLDRG